MKSATRLNEIILNSNEGARSCQRFSLRAAFLKTRWVVVAGLARVAELCCDADCALAETHTTDNMCPIDNISNNIKKKLQTIYLMLYKRQIKNCKNQKYKHEHIR